MAFVKYLKHLLYTLVVLAPTLSAGPVAAQDAEIRQTLFETQIARPFAQALTLLLGVVIVWSTTRGVLSVRRRRYSIAWRMSLKMLGWMPVLIGGGVMALLLLLDAADGAIPIGALEGVRVVGTVIPLAMGVMGAYALSPEDEPPLEIMLAAPRPITWALFERLAVMFGALAAVALAGTAATLALHPGEADLFTALMQWIPPALLFIGVGVLIATGARQAVFGVAVTLLAWFAMAFFDQYMLPVQSMSGFFRILQPMLWPISAYLQPGVLSTSDYLLNRALVSLVGLGLIGYAARRLSDEERTLLGGKASRKRRRPANAGKTAAI